MEAAQKGLFQRLFNIYPGEERQAFVFAFLGFIWAFGATCGLKFADALFLLHVGAASLPQAYTLISCGMFGIAVVLLYAFHKYSSYRIYLTTLLAGIAFYLFVSGCLLLQIGIRIEMAMVFLEACRILFIYRSDDLLLDLHRSVSSFQDAKRMYSLFTSTIFLGSACTGLLMHSGWLDLEHLMLLIIALLSLTYLWVVKIAKERPIVAHEDAEQEGQVFEPRNQFHYLIRSILSSPFTLLLMTSNFLIYLLLVITEYNYMFTFESIFASDPANNAGGGTEASLTLFLGKCLASVSVCNLFLAFLFIAARFVVLVSVAYC